MNKNNYSSGQITGTVTKLVLVMLLAGMLSGLQPLPVARGTLGASRPLGAPTTGDSAVIAPVLENQISGETIVIEPAGTVSWQEMLDFETANPVEIKPPTVVPYMSLPTPGELPGVGDSPTSGETTTVAPAGQANWKEMADYEAAHPVKTGAASVVPFMPAPEPGELSVLDGAPSLSPASPSGPLGSPEMVTNFLGLGDNNVSIPPDTMGAAGPDHLMVMLNTQVRIQSKTGSNISTVTLATFWTSGTGLTGSPFDPKVVYDSLSSRWMAVVDANSRSATSAVWFAISDDSDPTGSWTFYGFDVDSTNTYWADYPGLGINATWIAITNNMFQVSGTSFGGAKMWVIDKASALASGSLTTTVFAMGFDVAGGYAGFTLKPALTFDPAESTLYIVDGNGWGSGGVGLLRLSKITGTGPAPTWSVVPGSTVVSGSGWFWTTETYNLAQVNADQLGTTTKVATNDPRLLNAVLRNGRLWTTHSGGFPRGTTADRTISLWYEINPGGMPTPIVQSGTVGGGVGTHYFFPSITANANNDVALGFSYSDATQYVEAAFTGRESSDAPGTMGTVTTCKAGEDSYVKDFGQGSVRWGDYSATVVDPVDDLTFWTLQEYAETDVGGTASDDRWGTWWCSARVTKYEIFLPLILR
jgi:hypothetical protein